MEPVYLLQDNKGTNTQMRAIEESMSRKHNEVLAQYDEPPEEDDSVVMTREQYQQWEQQMREYGEGVEAEKAKLQQEIALWGTPTTTPLTQAEGKYNKTQASLLEAKEKNALLEERLAVREALKREELVTPASSNWGPLLTGATLGVGSVILLYFLKRHLE
jgi:hypothetical protein